MGNLGGSIILNHPQLYIVKRKCLGWWRRPMDLKLRFWMEKCHCFALGKLKELKIISCHEWKTALFSPNAAFHTQNWIRRMQPIFVQAQSTWQEGFEWNWFETKEGGVESFPCNSLQTGHEISGGSLHEEKWCGTWSFENIWKAVRIR